MMPRTFVPLRQPRPPSRSLFPQPRPSLVERRSGSGRSIVPLTSTPLPAGPLIIRPRSRPAVSDRIRRPISGSDLPHGDIGRCTGWDFGFWTGSELRNRANEIESGRASVQFRWPLDVQYRLTALLVGLIGPLRPTDRRRSKNHPELEQTANNSVGEVAQSASERDETISQSVRRARLPCSIRPSVRSSGTAVLDRPPAAVLGACEPIDRPNASSTSRPPTMDRPAAARFV